jgi:hypothetical protein
MVLAQDWGTGEMGSYPMSRVSVLQGENVLETNCTAM